MKRYWIAALAAAAVVGSLSPAPAQTFTYLRDIDLTAFESEPTGIVVSGTDAYVVGIGNRRLVKITNAHLPSASASILATTVSGDGTPVVTVPWVSGAGLVTVDFKAPNKVLVSGQPGGQTTSAGPDGRAFIVDSTSGALISDQAVNLDGGSALELGCAAFYGASNIAAAFQNGTNYWELTDTAPTLNNSGGGFVGGGTVVADPGGSGRFVMDMATGSDGTTLYVSYNRRFFDSTTIGIHKSTDDLVSPGSLAGNTGTYQWYEGTDGSTFEPYQGVGTFNYLANSRDYVLLSVLQTAGPANGVVRVIDSTNPATIVTVTDNIARPTDADVLTAGGAQYLLVTQTSPPRVTVLGIDGASSVSDFMLYN